MVKKFVLVLTVIVGIDAIIMTQLMQFLSDDMMPRSSKKLGGWFNIDKNDEDLVGLSIRGINYINNSLGLKPGYRFVGISGQPQSQVVFGFNYKATVVIRLVGKPYLYCDFFMYRKPLLAPDYLDTTSYTIGCQDGQNFYFTVTIPGEPLVSK